MSSTHSIRVGLIVLALVCSSAAWCSLNLPGRSSSGSVSSPLPSALRAGVGQVALTLPAGTPLAGYGSMNRRLLLPDRNPANGFTFFRPATGVMDSLSAKALVMANDTATVAFVTVDAVGMLADLADRIHARAAQLGVQIPRQHLVVSASHTHAGPGTQTRLRFWELAGTDRLFPSLRDAFVNDCAQALFLASQNLQPAKFGVSSASLTGVTVNRRVGVSPHVKPGTVDEELGVIRIDKMDGTPLALVWNFAVHGTMHDDTNLRFSADIMGAVSRLVEQQLGLTALFANGAEGDTAPNGSGPTGIAQVAPVIAQKIVALHGGITPDASITLQSASTVRSFGKATLDLSLQRLGAGSFGLDFNTLLSTTLPIGSIVFPMDDDWFENEFRFQAVRLNDTLIVPVPGEPIHFVGQALKTAGKDLGFARVFVFGLSNGHMAYITTEQEYNIGGYEGIATFFGPHTDDKVVSAATSQMVRVRP